MKIFLAGATGAIGRLLVPKLIQAGHDVTGSTRSPAKTASISAAGARPVVVDALDRDGLFAALASAQPDVVIHMMTDLNDRNFAANTRLRIEGTRNLVDAALAAGVGKIIAESISWVYGAGSMPASENEPLDINAPEGSARTVGAVQALEQASDEIPTAVILRFSILYGPGTWYDRDSFTTDQLQRGELDATDAITSFVHVADAAQAAFLALGWPAGVYNIADDEPVTGKIWIPVYAGLVGAPPPPVKDGAAGWERGAANAKARAHGWQPQYPTWREGFLSELT